MKAFATVVAKFFPGFFYWARLPGFAAFCGMAVGVSAARGCLAAVTFGAADVAVDTSSVAALLSLAAARALSYPVIYLVLLPAVAAVSAVAGVFCRAPVLRMAFFTVCGAALFAGSELELRDFYEKMEAAQKYNQILTLTARIASSPASTRAGYRFRAKVIDADNAEVARMLKGKTLQCTSRKPVPPYGVVTIQGTYSAPARAAGQTGFDQREHYAVNNIYGNLSVSRILADDDARRITSLTRRELSSRRSPASERSSSYEQTGSPEDAPRFSLANLSHTLRSRVHGVIARASSANARGVFHAAFLGEREHLPPGLNDLFRRSGIIHLLAISGFHAALLYTAVFTALGLFAIPPKARTLLSLAMLWGYLFFIGFIPSLFRATVMVTFFCLSMMLQRKNHAVHSLGMAGVLWLFLSPRSLFAPGFQLSFAATAGIIMMQPVFETLTKAVTARIRGVPARFVTGKILSPFWVSVAGFAATAPSLLHHFGTLSLYGILFNMIAIPLMSVAMWLFFAAVVLSPIDIVSFAAVWCAEKVLDAKIYLAGFSGHIAASEVIISRTTAAQLAAMVIFMAGLCCVSKDRRAVYALRAGGVAVLVIAASALYAAMTAKTETFTFKRNAAVANVVIHKDNTAWITAQGRAFDVKQLREREIEPFLIRKKIRGVPLFVINEEAEAEAHIFTFVTDYDPRMVVIRKERPGQSAGRPDSESFTRTDIRRFINADGTCTLSVDADGNIKIE